jgi:RNA polymerase sigma-70 factor (ECF subfamily)
MNGSEQPPQRFFPTTRWSLVTRAAKGLPEDRRAALEQLLPLYMPALKMHLVQKGTEVERAEDLLQGFISSHVLERQLVARADAERGKFRTFLLTAFNNYVRSELRRENAGKRSPARLLDIQAYPDEASYTREASEAFDVEWGRQVLARALREMQEECKAGGRDDLWVIFESRVVQPILGEAETLPYETLIQKLGLESPTQAANLLTTAKRMFARILRGIMSDYAKDEEIEQELQELRQILSRARA